MSTIKRGGHRGGHKSGFTLIELLVVIAIIGILSSVVLASLNSARQKGRDAKRISDVKQLQLALELYYDANQGYPLTVSTSTTPNLASAGYIAAIPTDPQTNALYSYKALQSDGSTACSSGPCAKYVIGAKLEGSSNSVFAGDVDTDYSGISGPDCDDADNMYCVNP
jgi:prepilin-type N-terminal cleavage/methylation domain-containing protein